MVLPPAVIETLGTSFSLKLLSGSIPIFSAVERLINATLSQVTFVIGSGSSCSQPLLAKRPSYNFASGLMAISIPSPALPELILFITDESPDDIDTVTDSKLVVLSTPSCRTSFQRLSKFPFSFACHVLTTDT